MDALIRMVRDGGAGGDDLAVITTDNQRRGEDTPRLPLACGDVDALEQLWQAGEAARPGSTEPSGQEATPEVPDDGPVEDATQPVEGGTQDSRVLLAVYPRGKNRELRVSRCILGSSNPFLRLQVWQTDGQGEWPLKGKDVTVRGHEIPTLLTALAGFVAADLPNRTEQTKVSVR